MDNDFKDIPSLDDIEGLNKYLEDQQAKQLGIDPNLDVNSQIVDNASETATVDEGTNKIIEELRQQNAELQARFDQLMANQAAAQQQPQVQAKQATGYNPQQRQIISELLNRGYTIEQIQQYIQGQSQNQNNAVLNRIQMLEDYIRNAEYRKEEANFISRMQSFGEKFGLSESDLVTFGNVALSKGINISEVSDLETVFRAVYPEQYAIRSQRANMSSSQIYGGTNIPTAPRYQQEKMEDMYVESFLKNAMPNR